MPPLRIRYLHIFLACPMEGQTACVPSGAILDERTGHHGRTRRSKRAPSQEGRIITQGHQGWGGSEEESWWSSGVQPCLFA